MKKLTYSLLTLAAVEDKIVAMGAPSWVDDVATDLNMTSQVIKSHLKTLSEVKVKEILNDANMKALLQGTDAEKEQMLFALVGLNDANKKKAFDMSNVIKEADTVPLDQVLAIANLSYLPVDYLDNLKKSDLDMFKVISSAQFSPLHQKIEIILEISKKLPLLSLDRLVALTNDADRAFMFSAVFDDGSIKDFDANMHSLMWFLQKTDQERQNLVNFAVQGITTRSMSDEGKDVVLTSWKTLVDGHYLDNLNLDESHKAYTWYMEVASDRASFEGMWTNASDLLDGITIWDEKLLCLDFYKDNTENAKIIQNLGVLVGLATWADKNAYIDSVNTFGDTYHALDGVAKGLDARNAFDWLTMHDEIFKALYDKTLLLDAKTWKLSFADKKDIVENMTKSADKIRHAEVPVFVNLDDDTCVADRRASIAKFFDDYASIGEALSKDGFIGADYETNGTESNALMQELMTLLGNDWESEVNALFPTLSLDKISPSTAWVDFVDNYVATNVFEATDTHKNRADILYSVWVNRFFLKECGVKLLENITGPEVKNALAKIIGVDKDSFWDAYKAGILAGVTTFDEKLAIIDKVKKAKTDNVWSILKGLLSGSELLLSLDYTDAQNIIDGNTDGFLLGDKYSVIQTQIAYYLEARTEGMIDMLKMVRQNTADGILALSDYHNYSDHAKYKEAIFLFSDADGALKALDLVKFYVGLTSDVIAKLDAMVDITHTRKTVFLTYYACPDAYRLFFLGLNTLASEQWLALKGYQDLTVEDKVLFDALYGQNMFAQAKTFADIKVLMDIYKGIPASDRVRLFRNLGHEAGSIHDHFVKASGDYAKAGVMASSLLFHDDISISDAGLSDARLIGDAQKARQMLEDYNFFANNPVVRSLVVGLDEQKTLFSYWNLGAMAFDIRTQEQKDAFAIMPFKDQPHNLHIAKDALMLYAVSSQMDSLLGLFSLFVNFERFFGASGYAVPHVDNFIEFFKKYTVVQALDGDNGLFIPLFQSQNIDSFALFLRIWDGFFENREFQGIDYFMNYFDWYNTPTRLKVTVDGVSYPVINGQLDRLFKSSKWNFNGKSLMSNLDSPMDFIPEVINMLCDGQEGDVDVTSALSILNMIPNGLLGQNLNNVSNIKHMVDTLKITMKLIENYKISLDDFGLLDNLIPNGALSSRDQEIAQMIDLLYGHFTPTLENAQHVLKTPQSGDDRAHSILSVTPLWGELDAVHMFDLLIPTVDPVLTGIPTKAQVDAARDHAILMEKIKLVNLIAEHKDRVRIYANVSQGAENADIRAAKIWYVVPLDVELTKHSLNIYVDNQAALDNTLIAHGVLPWDITADLAVDTDTASVSGGIGEWQADRARKIEMAIDLMPFYEKLTDKKEFVARFISLPYQRSAFAYIKNLVNPAKITNDADEMFAYAKMLLDLDTTYKAFQDLELALKLGKYGTPKIVKDLRGIGITAAMVPDVLGDITQNQAMNIALRAFPEFRVNGETFESLSASLIVHGVTLADLGFAHQFKTAILPDYTTYFKALGNYILGVSAFAQKMGEHADANKIEQFMNAGMKPSDLNGLDMSLSANRIALELTPFLSTLLTVNFVHPNVTQIVLSEGEKQAIADQVTGTVSDILAANILIENSNTLILNESFAQRQDAVNLYITKAAAYKEALDNNNWFQELDVDSSCLEVESDTLTRMLIKFEMLPSTSLVGAVKENVHARALRFMIQTTYAGLPLIEGTLINIDVLMGKLSDVTLDQINDVKDLMQPLLMANAHTSVDERAQYIKDLIGLNAACEITGVNKSYIEYLVGKVSKDDLIALHKFIPLATADAFITEAAKYVSGDLEPLMRDQTESQYDWYVAHKDLFSALQKNHLFDALEGSPKELTQSLTDQVWPFEITISMNMGSLESVADRAQRIIADVVSANPDKIPTEILAVLLDVESNVDRHDMLVGYAGVDRVLFAEIYAKKLFSNLHKWAAIKAVYDNYQTAKDDKVLDVLVKSLPDSDEDISAQNVGALKGYADLSVLDKEGFKELAAWSGIDYENKPQNIFVYIYEWESKHVYDSTFKRFLEYYKLAKKDGISDIFKNFENIYEQLQALETYGADNEWSGLKKDEHPKFIEAATVYKVFDGSTHWWDSDYTYKHDGVISEFHGYKLMGDGEAVKLLDPSTPQASRDVLRNYLNAYYSYAKDRLLSIPVASIQEMQDLFNGYAWDGNSSVFNMLYDEGVFTSLTVAGSTKWSDIARIMDEYVKAGHGNQDRIKGLSVDLPHQAALLDGYATDPNNAMFIYAYGAGVFQDWVGKLTSWDDVKIVLANFAAIKTSAPNDLPAMLNVPTAKQKREFLGICALAIQNNVLDKLTTLDQGVVDQELSKRNAASLYDKRSDFINAVNAAGFFDNMESLSKPFDFDWRNNYLRLIAKLETLSGNYAIDPIDMIDQIKADVDTKVSEGLPQRYERIEMAVLFYNSPLHKALVANVANEYADAPYNLYANLSDASALEGKKALLSALASDVTAADIALIAKYVNVASETGVARADRIKALVTAYKLAAENHDVELLILGNENSLVRMNDAFTWYSIPSNQKLFHLAKEKGMLENLKNSVLQHPDKGIASEYMALVGMFISPTQELDVTNAFNVNGSTMNGYIITENPISSREITVTQADADRGYVDIGGDNVSFYNGGMLAWVGGFTIPVHKPGQLHVELLKTLTGSGGNPTLKATKAVLTVAVDIPDVISKVSKLPVMADLPYKVASDRYDYIQKAMLLDDVIKVFYAALKSGQHINYQELIDELLKENGSDDLSNLVNRIKFCCDSADSSVMAGHKTAQERSAYILSLIKNIYSLDALNMSGSGDQDKLIKYLVSAGISYKQVSAVELIIGSSISGGEDARLRHIKMAIAVQDNDFAGGITDVLDGDDQPIPAGMSVVTNLFLGDGTVPLMPEQIYAINHLKPLPLLSIPEPLNARVTGLINTVASEFPAEVMALFDDSIQESFASKVKRLQLAQAVHYYHVANDLGMDAKAKDVVNALFADGITPDDIEALNGKIRLAPGNSVAQRVAVIEMALGIVKGNLTSGVDNEPLNVAILLAEADIRPAHILALGESFGALSGSTAQDRVSSIIAAKQAVQALNYVEFKEGELLQNQIRRIKLAVELDRSNLWSNLSGERPEKAILNALMEANINPAALYDLTLDCINTYTTESVEKRVKRISLAIALKAHGLELNATPVGTNYIEMIDSLLMRGITPEQLITGASLVDTTVPGSVEERINQILTAYVVERTGLVSDITDLDVAKGLVSLLAFEIDMNPDPVKIQPAFLLAMSLAGKLDTLGDTVNRASQIVIAYVAAKGAEEYISAVVEPFEAQVARASMALAVYYYISPSLNNSLDAQLLVSNLLNARYTSLQVKNIAPWVNIISEDLEYQIGMLINLYPHIAKIGDANLKAFVTALKTDNVEVQDVASVADLIMFKDGSSVAEKSTYLQDLIEYNKAFVAHGIYDHLSDGAIQTDEDRKILCNYMMGVFSPNPAPGGVDAIIAGLVLNLKKDGFNERGHERALRVIWVLAFDKISLSAVLSNMDGTSAQLINELISGEVVPAYSPATLAYVDVSVFDTPSVRAQRLAMAMALYGDGVNDLASGVGGIDMVNRLIQEGVVAEELYGIRTLLSFTTEDIGARVEIIKPFIVTYENILNAYWLNFNYGIGKMALVADKQSFLNYFGDATDGASRRDEYDALKREDLESITTFASLDLLMHPIVAS